MRAPLPSPGYGCWSICQRRLPHLTVHESTRSIGLALVLHSEHVCSLMAAHVFPRNCSYIHPALSRPSWSANQHSNSCVLSSGKTLLSKTPADVMKTRSKFLMAVGRCPFCSINPGQVIVHYRWRAAGTEPPPSYPLCQHFRRSTKASTRERTCLACAM